jgi:hypothetical protein
MDKEIIIKIVIGIGIAFSIGVAVGLFACLKAGSDYDDMFIE